MATTASRTRPPGGGMQIRPQYSGRPWPARTRRPLRSSCSRPKPSAPLLDVRHRPRTTPAGAAPWPVGPPWHLSEEDRRRFQRFGQGPLSRSRTRVSTTRSSDGPRSPRSPPPAVPTGSASRIGTSATSSSPRQAISNATRLAGEPDPQHRLRHGRTGEWGEGRGRTARLRGRAVRHRALSGERRAWRSRGPASASAAPRGY